MTLAADDPLKLRVGSVKRRDAIMLVIFFTLNVMPIINTVLDFGLPK